VTSRQLLVNACQRPITAVDFRSAPDDRNPRQHFRLVVLGNQQQRFHRDLPIGGIMLGFRQVGDVFGGVAQGQQLAPVQKHDRIIEPLEPNHSGGAIRGVSAGLIDKFDAAGISVPPHHTAVLGRFEAIQ
jgi:hypothetical protein